MLDCKRIIRMIKRHRYYFEFVAGVVLALFIGFVVGTVVQCWI